MVRIGSVRLSIPEQTAWRTGILGMSGSGKSNTAAVFVEDLFAAGEQVVIIDTESSWYGLRSSANGKGAGLPIAVFGGERRPELNLPDAPLEEPAGKYLAELVVSKRLSCVLDTSELSENGKHRFLADFAEALYSKNRDPLYLVLEEADDYAPQSGSLKGPAARTKGAFQRIVKRGRKRGIFPIMLTLRSAALDKDLLTQCDTLIVHRSPSPQDRKAIAGWVDHHGQAKEILSTLPSLANGEAWVWSPHVGEVMERTQVRTRTTFDSGRTPSGKKATTRPSTVADIDSRAIAEAMSEAIERQKAEDPRELKKEIAKLRRELADRPSAEPEVQVVERTVFPQELLDRLAEAESVVLEQGQHIKSHLQDLTTAQLELAGIVTDARKYSGNGRVAGVTPTRERRDLSPARPEPVTRRGASGPGDSSLPTMQRKILTVLAQHGPRTTDQLLLQAGYKKGGAWFTAVKRLQDAGYMENNTITKAGLDALGDYDPLPAGNALLSYWKNDLGAMCAKIIDALIRRDSQTTDELLTSTSYNLGGAWYTAMSKLGKLNIIKRDGGAVSLTDEFKEAIR